MGETREASARIAAWEAAYLAERPLQPEVLDRRGVAEMTSFSARGVSDGVVVRLVVDGTDRVDVNLNPFVARQLAASLVEAGIRGGWLNDDGEFIVLE